MTQRNEHNNFLPIIDSWRTYFENPYEGLGTLYERFILHRMFNRFRQEIDIHSVLEIPSFGMTGISGINSLWWANYGAKVCVADWDRERLHHIETTWHNLELPVETVFWEQHKPIPYAERSFDLVWNFASFWFIADSEIYASEMQRVSAKAVLICVPNYSGFGFLLRKRFAQSDNGIYLENIRPAFLKSLFCRAGWKLKEEGIFDVPPWPDIAMKKEELLKKLGLGFLLSLLNGDSVDSAGQPAGATIIDYFSGKAPNLENEILKYDYFEKKSGWFPSIWGHHRYFLFARDRL